MLMCEDMTSCTDLAHRHAINQIGTFCHCSAWLQLLLGVHNHRRSIQLLSQVMLSIHEIALKCREPSPAHMQISTCVLEGCITLAKMAENSLTF